jgi:hypothetical protein
LEKCKVELARVQCIPGGITKGWIKAFFVENLIFCCSTFDNNIEQHLRWKRSAECDIKKN